jgi:L-iditol 2-dehydrogenase
MYAERAVVPAPIVAGNLHRIPEGMDASTAALAENLACVLKAYDRCPVRAGERVVVLGAGALGLLWTRLLALSGARVTAVDPHPDRRAAALALGADAAEDSGAFEEALEGGRERPDVVVEAVGTTQAWEVALEAAAPGGRVVLFGGPERGTSVTLDTQRMHYDELLLVSSFHHTPYHFAEAVRALAQGFLDASLVVTERIALVDLPAFFRRGFEGAAPPKAAVVP